MSEIDFGALYARLDQVGRALAQTEPEGEARAHLLDARTAALAERREQRQAAGEEVVGVQVGGERYLIPIAHAEEVAELREVCPLPGAPGWVLGAMLARSRAIVLLDLRQLLGLGGGGLSDLTKVVVVTVGDEQFGLAVEAVEGRQEVRRGVGRAAFAGPFLWVAEDGRAALDPARLGATTGPATGAGG